VHGAPGDTDVAGRRLPQFRSSRLEPTANRGRCWHETKTREKGSSNVFGRLFERFCHQGFASDGSHGPARSSNASAPPAAESRQPRLGRLFVRVKSSSHERPLVQPELGLDNIRVVRNDLSDADLQIVAATRRAPARSAVKARRSEPDSPRVSDSRFIWDRLTARLFAAGRSRLE
jgi:hypothetical protein